MDLATTPPDDPSLERSVFRDDEVQALLDALRDPSCRTVLNATGEASLSASELSETCDLPLSTTYRKLDTLTDVGLLEEHTRICADGKHASEYTCRVETVDVDVSGEGFELTVWRR
jgi:DNA-binding transcriptional ArsR family regulator